MLALQTELPAAISVNGCSSAVGELSELPEPPPLGFSFDRELLASLPFPRPGLSVCLNPSKRFLFGFGDPTATAVLPVRPSLLFDLDFSEWNSVESYPSLVPAELLEVAGDSCFRTCVAIGSLVDFERGCDCVLRMGFVIWRLAMSGADLNTQKTSSSPKIHPGQNS